MVDYDVPQESGNGKGSLVLSLDADLIDKIDEIIFLLRKQSPSFKKKKLNRSKFFEMLLSVTIQDYENRSEHSTVLRVYNMWLNSNG